MVLVMDLIRIQVDCIIVYCGECVDDIIMCTMLLSNNINYVITISYYCLYGHPQLEKVRITSSKWGGYSLSEM